MTAPTLKPFPMTTLTEDEIQRERDRREGNGYNPDFNVANFEYRESLYHFVRDHFGVGRTFNLVGEDAMVVEFERGGIGRTITGVVALHKAPGGGLTKTLVPIEALAAIAGYEPPVTPWVKKTKSEIASTDSPVVPQPTTP